MGDRLRRGLSGFSTAQALVCVLVLAAVLRVTLALLTPPLFAADEAGHLLYIHQVAVGHHLPIQTLDGRWANANGAEDFYHPPLYYLLVAPLYAVIFPSHLALYAVRFVDVILGLALVVVVHSFTRRHFGDLRWAAPVAALLVAVLPTMVGVSSSVNNDALSPLLITMVTAELCRPLVTGRVRVRELALVSLLFGAALYTKNSALVLVPALLLWGPVVFREDRRRWPMGLVPAVAGLLCIVPWWLLRNQPAYGSLLAVDLNWGLRGGPLLTRLVATLLYMNQTFWTALGRSVEIALPYWTGGLFTLVLYAAARHLIRNRRRLTDVQRRVLLLVLVPLPVAFLQAIYYGVTWGFGQGRYLYPAVLGIAVVLAVGFTQRVSVRQRRARLALVSAVVPFWTFFLLGVLLPGYASVSVESTVGSLSGVPPFRTGDLDAWVFHRTAPLRAEDSCRSMTHSPLSPAC